MNYIFPKNKMNEYLGLFRERFLIFSQNSRKIYFYDLKYNYSKLIFEKNEKHQIKLIKSQMFQNLAIFFLQNNFINGKLLIYDFKLKEIIFEDNIPFFITKGQKILISFKTQKIYIFAKQNLKFIGNENDFDIELLETKNISISFDFKKSKKFQEINSNLIDFNYFSKSNKKKKIINLFKKIKHQKIRKKIKILNKIKIDPIEITS